MAQRRRKPACLLLRCAWCMYRQARQANVALIERSGIKKAISFYFAPSSFTSAQYDKTMRRLEAAAAGSPEGCTYHVALDTNGNIQVFDIWESQEAFEAFGATLMPILSDLSDAGEPMVAVVHNVKIG
jgi:hypothetical protein